MASDDARRRHRAVRRGRAAADDPVQPGDDAMNVADECEAFLWGRLVEWLIDEGRPIPTWAWLNKLAHATAEEIEAVAEGEVAYSATREFDDWNQAVTVVAGDLIEQVDGDESLLGNVQRTLLVPFELAAMQSGTSFPMTPALLVSISRAVLRRHPSVGL